MFVVVVIAGLTIGWLVRSAPGDVATIGSPAPDFTVEVIDGGTFTLSEAEGRPVVVNFWASWCGPCRTEIPAISEYAESNPGVQVIGVALRDEEVDSREFAAEVGATYPLALGTEEIAEAYPGFGLPYTVIVDENGVVAEIHNGVVDAVVLEDLVG